MFLKKKISLLTLMVFTCVMALSIVACSASAATDKTRIMCYGDSNTWGWMPVKSGSTTRYPSDVRWTGLLQEKLGNQYVVIEEGLNGRTTGVDDFANSLDATISEGLNLNGNPTLLPILKSQAPLDVVVIMLGTNDVKPHLRQDINKISASMERLVEMVKKSSTEGMDWTLYKAPKVLVVAPVPVRVGESKDMNDTFVGGYELSTEIGNAYKDVAKRQGVEFLDASKIIPAADGLDGIHLSPEGHKKLAAAIEKKIKSML